MEQEQNKIEEQSPTFQVQNQNPLDTNENQPNLNETVQLQQEGSISNVSLQNADQFFSNQQPDILNLNINNPDPNQQQVVQNVDLLGNNSNNNNPEADGNTAKFVLHSNQINNDNSNNNNQENKDSQNQSIDQFVVIQQQEQQVQPQTQVQQLQQQPQQQSVQQPYDISLDCQTMKKVRRPNQNQNQNYNYNPIQFQNKYLNVSIFNDDDEIQVIQQQQVQEIQEKQKYDITKGLTLQLQALQNKIQLSKTNSKKIPILFSMKTKDSTDENYEVNLEDMNIKERASIDLIVVVDHSGSMSGTKIELVNKTLKYLLTILTERDRLCLIMFDNFAQRLTPLKKNTKENLEFFTQNIDSIHADGGTQIALGIKLALQQINERKYKNEVTSIFLLSDGLDGGADNQVKDLLQTFNIKDPFSINTFGLGDDHDENLMKGIANQKDGGFYYIQNFSLVDECFVDALGGLISVVGQNVQIKAKVEATASFEDLRVSNCFGIWQFDDINKIYSLNQNQLLSGISRDYVFEINIPPIKQPLNEQERTQRIIFKTEVLVQEIYGNKEIKNFNAELKVDFVEAPADEEENKDNVVEGQAQPNNEINKDVMIHYLRVQGAYALEQAKQKAQMMQFEQAQTILQNIINQITSSGFLDDAALRLLLEDLQRSLSSCRPYEFENYGAKYMTSRIQCHTFQQSSVQMPQQYQFQQNYPSYQQNFGLDNQTISIPRMQQQQQQQQLQQPQFGNDLQQQQLQLEQEQQQQMSFDPYSNTIKKKFINQLRQQKQ